MIVDRIPARPQRWFMALVVTLLAVSVVNADSPQPLTAEATEFFEAKIRPILVEHCYECHSGQADDVEAGLMLDSRAGWQQGGDSGPPIVPGDVEQSLLIEAVRYKEEVVSGMPPRSKLPAEQIRLLETWVEMGAPDPRQQGPAPAARREAFDLQKRFAEHWSWRPVSSPDLPSVNDHRWPKRDLDRFVLARIEQAGLRPALPADRRTWIRRVYFDLIGLPPTIEQLDRFLADDSPEAESIVIAELLDSQQFGEKWARHWLDLVRYADTHGHEFDYAIDHSYEYRDYVIRALNADVPFDQFVREHIAGDLLDPPRRHPQQNFNESIIGTGFWYLHEATHAPTDVLGNEADIIDNQLDVFGKAFLGLTVACARCHDHKFDAISTADYYALSAYLQSSCRQKYPLDPGRRIAKATAEIRRLRNLAVTSFRQADLGQERLKPARYYQAATELIRRAQSSLPDAVQSTDQVNEHDGSGARSKKNRLPQPSNDWVSQAAVELELDPTSLQRWITVLTAVDLDAPVTTAEAVLAAAVDQSDSFDSLGRKFKARAQQATRRQSPPTLTEDFQSGELPPGWSTSGQAFLANSDRLSLPLDPAWPGRPGTIDSGVLGSEQAGILRSPTFEISTPQIRVRMRATPGVSVNVVIDNYQMAEFSALLFKGTLLRGDQSDTQGQWQWKTFAGDLNKYIGHKAYLEFVDHGAGAISIDEVRFADRGRPAETIDPLIVELTGGVVAIGSLWQRAQADLPAGRHNDFLAWLIQHQLIDVTALSDAAGQALGKARDLAGDLPRPRYVLAMADGTPEPAHIYIRGSHTNLGPQVPARFLEALGGRPAGRLDLANLVASSDNPLTARVIVNRVWHHLTGRGIAASVDDFGPQGQRPTHPQLLDRLARDFIDQGWSLKSLISEIVSSQTYRQSSVAHPQLDRQRVADVDPSNLLLHRMRVRRLKAEAIRDSMLAISGRLDLEPFGPGVPTYRNEFMTGRGARDSGPLDGNGRRSIYLTVYRNFLNPFLVTFDMPSPFGPKGRRSNSNVPAQALTLMNDPLVIEQANVWAEQVLAEADHSDRDRIALMVEQAHGSDASDQQLAAMLDFVRSQEKLYGASDKRAWADLGHALWNMKSFYYLR